MKYLLMGFCLFSFLGRTGETMSLFSQPGDRHLQQAAIEVPFDEITSLENQRIIEEMLAIAKGERSDTDKRVMVGLAAPQIGIMKQIILVDVSVEAGRKNLGELKVYINPKIIWSSSECDPGREGCYSVDERLVGIVLRPNHIRVTAFDQDGNLIEEELFGFTARIFQHEVDHLHGIRFPDRVSKKGILHWVTDEQYPLYRETWQEWTCNCPWEVWENMREGIPYSFDGSQQHIAKAMNSDSKD